MVHQHLHFQSVTQFEAQEVWLSHPEISESALNIYADNKFLLFLHRIDIFKYVIYGVAAAFFVYGILLMVEGFFTTGAIKDLYGDFKITTCGRCVSAWVSG